ncbi:EAL and HDOD domain-containing protein [Thiobacter aerophilum]|uniref:HDOD domain-containing protein n=1 Tax=Thiobacter aerophilum TaxID=3121275 RepID=A0ABV0EFC5_9BURK
MTWKFLPRPSDRRTPPASPPSGGAPADDVVQGPDTPQTVFLAREPIIDVTQRVVGYALLVRAGGLLPPGKPRHAAEEINLVLDTLNRFGVEQALGEKQGFLRLGVPCLLSDLVEVIPRQRFVLEYGAPEPLDEASLSRLATLRERGYRLARHWQGEEHGLLDVGKTASLVIYDLALTPLQEIARIDRLVKAHKLQRLVRNVNSRTDFEVCRAHGFDFYQGRLLAPGQTLVMNKLDPSRLRVMELFNLVIKRADVGEIENAFKHDVALCYSLLCYINSAGIGLQYKVSSIRDAVMLLGYDFLWRWLSLLIFAGVDLTAGQRLLLSTAVIRGRLAELLGQSRLSSREGNHLFITGMFSLLDALLGVPLAEVATRLHLPEDVTQALLARKGRYAPYLELALAFENDDVERAAQLCQELGMDLDEASRAHLAAIEWAGVLAK